MPLNLMAVSGVLAGDQVLKTLLRRPNRTGPEKDAPHMHTNGAVRAAEAGQAKTVTLQRPAPQRTGLQVA